MFIWKSAFLKVDGYARVIYSCCYVACTCLSFERYPSKMARLVVWGIMCQRATLGTWICSYFHMTYTPYMSLWSVENQFRMYPLHLGTTIAYAGREMTPSSKILFTQWAGLEFYFCILLYISRWPGWPFCFSASQVIECVYQKLVVRPRITQKWAPKNQMSRFTHYELRSQQQTQPIKN